MGSFQSYLEKLGSNFLVASFIPSLTFVIICVFLVYPFIPINSFSYVKDIFFLFDQPSLFLIVLSILLGFFLTSLNNFFIKLFEGYVLLHRINLIKKKEQKRYLLIKNKIKQTDKLIQTINKRLEQNPNKNFENKRNRLFLLKQKLLIQLDRNFPKTKSEVMPTKFGNILKASEYYSVDRYNIDAVPMWPRILHVIPNSYKSELEETLNQLTFLINCSILSILILVISIGLFVFRFNVFLVNHYLNLNLRAVFSLDIFKQDFILYGVFIFCFAALSVIFYRAALFALTEYSDMIRSTYDLFRFDLLEQLHIKLPDSIDEERELWNDICAYINTGINPQHEQANDLSDELDVERIPLDPYIVYTHPQKKNQ